MNPSRRRFLKVLGGAGIGAAVSAPFMRAFADNPSTDEFFVFILATGGWDVTLWSDPRNTVQGLVNPASDKNTNIAVIPAPDLWKPVPLDGDSNSFEILKPTGNSPLIFGPGIGRLIDQYDRLCLINGLAMNTVSHPDGKAFSATGRHLAGGHPAASSIDTMVTNELGLTQLLPNVSIVFPSSYIGTNLDPRASPLIVDSVGTIGKSLSRSSLYDTSADRDAVTAVLTEEALDLAKLSDDPDPMNGMALQYGSLKKMLSPTVQPTFSASALALAQPDFFTGTYKPKFQTDSATNAAFIVEAMRLNLVRCVSFAFNAFDTHNSNYMFHLQTQQEAFNVLSTLVSVLDKTPHPTLAGKMLSDHTHILVVSDFCRTPQINLAGGRDHYPNNSALVISPKFKQNYLYSGTDEEQLLPKDVAGTFSDGPRPIGPPDLLTTFVSAFGIDPRKYLRDGEVVKDLLV